MTRGYRSVLALLLLTLLSACGIQEAMALPVELHPAPLRAEALSSAEKALPKVYLSELMAANKATLADENGSFPDWLELHNASAEPLSLKGWSLERDGKRFPLPDTLLEAGDYALFFSAQLGDMSIPKSGCSLRLLDARGRGIDALELPALGDDRSACRDAGGEMRITSFPSPGRENSDEGYRAWQESLLPLEGEPVLGEAMVYNARYLGINGSHYDWLEITNPWDAPVQLEGYFLSDKESNRRLFALPRHRLEPGKSLIVYCSDEEMPEGSLNSGFKLDSVCEQLYLSRADGSLVDYASLHDVPLDGSLGRMGREGGRWYFTAPTPGKPNREGCRLIAEKPRALTPDGVYEGVEELVVALEGEGEIRYTLDGSQPDAQAKLYTEPLRIEKTCVLRAVCLREGYLRSESLDQSYFLNEGHSLPVLSLVGDPKDITGPLGLYTQRDYEIERPVSFSLFDGQERLQIRCGLKLHGATSRIREKKSFKLQFKDRYEGMLEHDLFSNGVTQFRSILLRMPQEGRPSSYMRDTLMHQLAIECFPSLPAQDHRYGVLYLNGVYWGVYNMREAHSETHFAQHYGVDESRVLQSKGSWGHEVPAEEVTDYLLNADLAEEEAYACAEAHLDLESIIGWCILEAYSGNFDANSPNMRFYWDGTNQRLHYALVDLDLGMFSYEGFDIPFADGYAYERLAMKLMDNEAFRTRLFTRLGELLRGPMSQEQMHRRIDALAEQLRPEMERDMLRWGNKPQDWESMLRVLHEFVEFGEGRSRELIKSLRILSFITSQDLAEHFADFGF